MRVFSNIDISVDLITSFSEMSRTIKFYCSWACSRS